MKIAKGTRVIKFSSWDGRGTFTFRDMIVESWGAKRATLRDVATDEMLGTALPPCVRDLIFPAADFAGAEAIEAKALELAAAHIAEKSERARRNIEQAAAPHAVKSWRGVLDELHEPRAIEWNAARAAA